MGRRCRLQETLHAMTFITGLLHADVICWLRPIQICIVGIKALTACGTDMDCILTISRGTQGDVLTARQSIMDLTLMCWWIAKCMLPMLRAARESMPAGAAAHRRA